METRRQALKIIGAVGAACSFPFSANELFGQHVHQAEAAAVEAPAAVPFEPQFFSAEEYRVVSKLADLIIPTADTPGAVAAGVPQYIDLVVNGDHKLQAILANGLRDLQR